MKKTTRRRRKDGRGERPVPAIEVPGGRAAPSREDIARRAYEISLTRDTGAGDPMADWLQAEQDLLQR